MIKQIFSGISAYKEAFVLLSKLKLWNYFIIPTVISLLTFLFIVYTAIEYSATIGKLLAEIWIWNWGKEIVMMLSSFGGGLVILVIGLMLYKYIVLAISAPFMGVVSEKIELHLNGGFYADYKKTTFIAQLWRGIQVNVRNLGMELFFTFPLLLLKFIPVVNLFSSVLLFLIQAYYAGFGNMDYTLERYFSFKKSLGFVKKNTGYSIGNGIVFIGCLFLPVLGIIIVLPLSVTAASIQTIALLNKENERSIL
ncbi:MAG: EI24 domain-containing protein [Polaribacter sp.]|jgi:CysZ protein|nr:EI24 domain-containing protein [Polaribacter sp.]MBT6081900.1 EI24 domain-containing protein [Polaribacter sp.]MBT7135029.1 EI24 domain-containing protein [Polaribacter sp.]